MTQIFKVLLKRFDRSSKQLIKICQILVRDRFVQCDGNGLAIQFPEVDACFLSPLKKGIRVFGVASNANCVKKMIVLDGVATLLGSFSQKAAHLVDVISDFPESFRTMKDGVHGRHVGK